MQVGAMYMGGPFSLKEFAVAAEDVGFDSVWVGDHVAHYVDGTAGLGILAGCTDRVTIGTNVIVVPFRPAAVVAKAALTVQSSAKRRVILGVGPGGDVPHEFAMTGADLSTRGRRTDEALEVIRGLWGQTPFSFHGRWNDFDGVTMEPVGGPRPELWIGGRSSAALRRAVRFGRGYNPYLVSVTQVADRYARLRSIAAEAGVSLDGFELAATTFHVGGPDVDTAAEHGYRGSGFRGMSGEQFREFYALGTPDDVLVRLRAYGDVGVQHLVIGCAPGADDQLGSFLSAFRQILPELHGVPR